MKNKLILLFILFLAAFLRFYNLENLPINAHTDEITNTYVGRFIWQNAVDLYGNKWPILYFDKFGDYPNVIPMYLSGLTTYVFGFNKLAMRFPIALFGVLAVYLIYLLGKAIFKSEKMALFSAFTLAIFPWHIVLSRATAEGVTAMAVFALGFYLLIQGIEKNRVLLLISSFLILLGTYLFYASYRILIPLFLLPTFLLASQRKTKTLLIIFAIISIILTGLISQTNWGKGRFKQTSIFSPTSLVYPMQGEFLAEEGQSNVLKSKIFFNKPLMFTREFIKQYLKYFSPEFLFSMGGLPKRYQVPEQGLWYYSYLLLFISLIILGKKTINLEKSKNKYLIFLLYLLAIIPIPGALTIDDAPNLHRTALMAFTLSLLASIPFITLQNLKWKKINFNWLLFLMMGLETIYFWNKYAMHADKYNELDRNKGYDNLAKFLLDKKDQYQQIFVERNGEIAIYYLFYSHNFDKNLSKQFGFDLRLEKVDNISFTDYECVYPGNYPDSKQFKDSLFIFSTSCNERLNKYFSLHPEFKKVEEIHSSSGSEMFEVYLLN